MFTSLQSTFVFILSAYLSVDSPKRHHSATVTPHSQRGRQLVCIDFFPCLISDDRVWVILIILQNHN